MTNAPEIKLRADGSIDTQYYMQIGRQKRSEQAHKALKFKWPRWRFSQQLSKFGTVE